MIIGALNYSPELHSAYTPHNWPFFVNRMDEILVICLIYSWYIIEFFTTRLPMHKRYIACGWLHKGTKSIIFSRKQAVICSNTEQQNASRVHNNFVSWFNIKDVIFVDALSVIRHV